MMMMMMIIMMIIIVFAYANTTIYITNCSTSLLRHPVKINEVPLPLSSGDLASSTIMDQPSGGSLISREVMIGIIVWLILLSLIILIVLLCLCVRKMKEDGNDSSFAKQPDRRHKCDENTGYSKDFRFY